MLKVLDKSDEIDTAQKKFLEIFQEKADNTVWAKASFQGGFEESEFYWLDNLEYWMTSLKLETRYWNGFGIEEPQENKGHTITCEINFPLKGIDRRIAAAFAKDENGEIYVVHRGKLGGNYSKKFFEENYRGKWTEIEDGDQVNNFVVIGKLNDPDFPQKVREFVYDVHRMKNNIPIINIRSSLEQIMREYHTATKEKINKTRSMYKLIVNEFTDYLNKIISNSDDYIFKGSVGQGNWTDFPWIAIFNEKITSSAKKGFYPVYLFSEDMKRVYLSFNQGSEKIQKELGTSEAKIQLEINANNFRSLLSPYNVNENFEEKIDLRTNKIKGVLYELGNIYAKSYDRDFLPTEEELESDLKEILRLYDIIVSKNSNSKINKWLLVTKDPKNWEDLEESEETTWSGNKDTKSGDILLMYNTSPRNTIDFIFKAKDVYYDDYYDKEWNSYAVDMYHKIKIPNPVEFSELKINPIISQWNAIKISFMGTSFEVPEDVWIEIKRLILEKNPELESQINQLESDNMADDGLGFYDIEAGRAHIVRDICYLISKNDSLNENELFETLRKNVTDENYWKAHYQRSNKHNIPKYNLNSARTLNLVEKDRIKLTKLGEELINNISNDELFTYEYSIGIKNFFYQLALKYDNIKAAMEILKEKKRLRFYNPTCNLTNRVIEHYNDFQDVNNCIEDSYENCEDCDRDLQSHIKESSLPFEVLKKTGKWRGNIFWMTSRVTPMHLTGTDPVYSGNYIEWDFEAEKELELEPETPKFDSFTKFLSYAGFYFEPETIENFLISLKAKPFIILTGNSGTGKTKIAQLFCEYLALSIGECHKIVPVGANWTENRHIVGFYNVITKEYMKSDALELILEAKKPENKNKPFFLILDEMNLSHVERYFADFLSTMESDAEISLHKSNKEEDKDDGEGVPKSIEIPKNLFVIGTVNIDETTYMFSPKVLDRANVIEFSTIPAKDYLINGLNQVELKGDINYLEDPLYDHDLEKSLRKSRIKHLKGYLNNVKTDNGTNLWDVLSEQLTIFQDKLKDAGFDFGFRVIDEILRYMYVAWYYDGEKEVWDNWERYFDSQIKQKMLPKIHGSHRTLENVIQELFELCIDEKLETPPRKYNISSKEYVRYPSSALKLQEMDKVLYEQRYVAFIN